MTTNYKILGQELNTLKYQVPSNTNTIISKLKIKNTSYPANINVNIGPSASFSELPDDFSIDLNNNASIFHYTLQSDNKIIICGNFTTIDGITRNHIARLNSDGTLDTGFDPDADGSVDLAIIQSDGKIIISGNFTTVGGIARYKIARLNSDGTIDVDFDTDINVGSILSMDLQSDGKILLGGNFLSIDGINRNRIARLNSDGTVDSEFNPNANQTVRSIIALPDGKILVGGSFTELGGIVRNRLAKLNSNGTVDTEFNPNVGTNDENLTSIVIQSDNKILIGGNFTQVGGTAKNLIARLNSDGTLDASFNYTFNENIPTIYGLALDSQDKILIFGSFISYSNFSTGRCIIRLNSDGTEDASLNLIFYMFGIPNIAAVFIDPKGKIMISGMFQKINGIQVNNQNSRLSLQSANNNTYLIKNKEIDFDDTIEINGGIALEEGHILLVDTPNGEDIIVQAYGIEETI